MRSAFGVDHGDRVYKSLPLGIAMLPAAYAAEAVKGVKSLRHAPRAAKKAMRPRAVKLAEAESRGRRIAEMNRTRTDPGRWDTEVSRPMFGAKRRAYDRGLNS